MTTEYKKINDPPVPPSPQDAAQGGGGGFEILVFKTNLNYSDHVDEVMPLLNNHPKIIEWNVDLHDCDNILRVISENIAAKEVEEIILNAGYFCEELN